MGGVEGAQVQFDAVESKVQVRWGELVQHKRNHLLQPFAEQGAQLVLQAVPVYVPADICLDGQSPDEV
ncbi:MAG: hypothetical protein OHK0039_16290 [Bacteroidia bacterium]